MKNLLPLLLAAPLLLGIPRVDSTRAADAVDVSAVLDKAIQALGGKTNLAKARAITWKSKGTLIWDGNENPFTSQTTLADLQHARIEFEGEFAGNAVRGVTLLDGDQGWRDISGNRTDLDREAIANERRSLYLQLVPALILPLQDPSQGFRIESATRVKLDGRSAVDLKIVPRDGRVFTLTLDDESGRPIRTVADVVDFMGVEYRQETLFSDYRGWSGIQKATRLRFKRDGQSMMEVEILDFKPLDQVELKRTVD